MYNEEVACLAEQMKNGDLSALEKIYALTYKRVYYIIYQMIKSREDSQDILQETYIRAFSKINMLDDTRNFYTWLIKIAVNLTKNFIKKNRTLLIDNENESLIESIADDTSDIPENIIREETYAVLLGLINILPPEQKRAVILYYYEKMPVTDIAQIEECSVSTITSRLSYARTALKKAVTSYEKKNNVQLRCGTMALSLYTAVSAAEPVYMLPAVTAAEILISVINALGFTDLAEGAIKYITEISVGDEEKKEKSEAGREKLRIFKLFASKRFIFSVNPIYLAILIACVVLITALLKFTVFQTADAEAAAAKGLSDILTETVASSDITGLPKASRNEITVKSFDALKSAVYDGSADVINIEGVISAESTIKISSSVTITGGEITRYDETDSSFFDGVIFNVTNNYDFSAENVLTLKNVVVDGGCFDWETDEYTKKAGVMIKIGNSSSLVLDGAVIKNNYSVSEDGSSIAGSSVKLIDIRGGTEIINCRYTGHGGAASVRGGKVSISGGCKFSGNISEGSGGVIAIYSDVTLNIDGAEFLYNKSINSEGGGGVIATDGKSTVNISNSIFRNNRASLTGGIIGAVNGTEINITGSTIENNSAAMMAGAIYIADGCVLTIDGNSKLISNSADDYGGAIYSRSGAVYINSGKISYNQSGNGGAVFMCSGSALIVNGGEISNNTAEENGGAISLESYESPCSLTINGGEISYNEANIGGAINLIDSSLTMTAGKIQSNKSDNGAGAICGCRSSDSTMAEDKIFILLTGGEISGNITTGGGGGIFDKLIPLTQTGGIITNNTAAAGSGLYLRGQMRVALTTDGITDDIDKDNDTEVVYTNKSGQ